MDRRSWPWSKKASAKVPKTSIKGVDGPLPRVYVEEGRPRIEVDNASVLEDVGLREQAEEKVRSLMEKLASVLEDLATKEDLVKQHGKVAEDAVSGWEKAEAEALSLKEELEVSIQQRKVIEDRVAHLEAALNESMRQVRLGREEEGQKIEEAILSKMREWEKIKVELDAKSAAQTRRLMESEAQNSAMTKSLQERTRTIEEVKEGKAKAETEVRLLQVKLDACEKEIAALKYELHVLNKELEIRNEEREYSRKSADVAHKQHLENVKKIAKLESENQRLRTLVRKKLPSAAALAQMKLEIDGYRREATGEYRRRNSLNSSKGSPSPPSAGSNHHMRDQSCKEVDLLTERLLSMEEETKLLKEALNKRSAELQAARQLCARTASKLSVAEDQLESLHGTPRGSKNGNDLHSERNFGCKSEEGIACTDDEVSCAESWASALVAELAHFKKNRATSHVSRQSMESSNFDTIEEFLEVERNAALELSPIRPVDCFSPVDRGCSMAENQQLQINQSLKEQEPTTSKDMATNADKLQTARLSCKELNRKLFRVEEQLQALDSHSNLDRTTISLQVQESLKVLVDARLKVSILDVAFDELQIAVMSMNRTEGNDANSFTADQLCGRTLSKGKPVGSLRFIMCKLIMLLEMLLHAHLPSAPLQAEDNSCPSITDLSMEPGCLRSLQRELKMRGLKEAKDKCLQGKAGLPEFLLRLGILLSGLCGTDCSELDQLLSEELTGPGAEDKENADNGGREAELAELLSCTEAKAMELEKQLSNTDDELKRTHSELKEGKEFVTELQGRITELQRAEEKLSEEESVRVELQARLQKAEEQVRELEGNVAALREEVAEQQKQYEGAVTKCEELEHQLSGFLDVQQTNSAILMREDDIRIKKERELAVAKENLAECQRTIIVLGKQLKALSSSPTLSPATSFDSTSMGSASLDRRVFSAREFLPVTDDMQRFAANREGQVMYLHHHHHRRRARLSYRQEPFNDYDLPHWSPSRGCYVQDPSYYIPNQRHNRHIAPDLRFVEGNGIAHPQLSPINDCPEKCPERLTVTVYSPSHTALSSPAGSPGPVLQLGAQRRSGDAAATNLEKSMNRAPAVGSNPTKCRKSSSSSRLRQFFSRSKNCR